MVVPYQIWMLQRLEAMMVETERGNLTTWLNASKMAAKSSPSVIVFKAVRSIREAAYCFPLLQQKSEHA